MLPAVRKVHAISESSEVCHLLPTTWFERETGENNSLETLWPLLPAEEDVPLSSLIYRCSLISNVNEADCTAIFAFERP